MRAVEIRAFGLDNLALVERPEPSCGPGQIRVRVVAVSLNYRDVLMVAGRYNPKQALPLVPCSDAVGVVEEVGSGVFTPRVGDRVVSTFFQDHDRGLLTRAKLRTSLGGPCQGVLAEQVVLDARGVLPAPAELSDEEAACLPCAGVTAWSALAEQGHVEPGHWVLCLGTGGVSIFALQLAKSMGGKVVITSSEDAKLARAAELGADLMVNYRTNPDWDHEVRRLVGGDGVDLVVEVGGAGTFDRSVRCTRPDGLVALIGVLAGPQPVNLVPVLMNNIRVQGIIVGSRQAQARMQDAIARHRIRPVVHEVLPLTRARQAFELLASGSHFGKVCVRVD